MSREGVDLDSDFWLVAPLARADELLVTASDDEVIIFDNRTRHIHVLNQLTAAVWSRCDGRATIPRIATEVAKELGTPVDAEAVGLALTKLADVDLVSGPVPVAPVSHRGFTRRKAMLGAATIPALVSITAPLASAAASSCNEPEIDQGSCRFASRNRCCRRLNLPYEGICSETVNGDYECVPRESLLFRR